MKLLDSCILIYSIHPAHVQVLRPLMRASDVRVSAISIPEVLGFTGLSNADEATFRIVFQSMGVLEVDRSVLYRAAELRQCRRMKLGDAIIAATALTHGCELVTRNVGDFRAVPNLVLINPFPSQP